MLLLLEPKTIELRPELKALLAGERKLLDMAQSPDDLKCAQAFSAIARLRLQEDWESRYVRLQAVSSEILRSPRANTEILSEMLDLILIIIGMLGQKPGDAFWPEARLLRTLRCSVERRDGLEKISQALKF
jgi:hypothetical protein